MSLHTASLALHATQRNILTNIEDLRSSLSRQACGDEDTGSVAAAAVKLEAASTRVHQASDTLAALQRRLLTLESDLRTETD